MTKRAAQEKVVRLRASFIAWLCGAEPHPDTGKWFERPEDRRGAFWWRIELEQEIARHRKAKR